MVFVPGPRVGDDVDSDRGLTEPEFVDPHVIRSWVTDWAEEAERKFDALPWWSRTRDLMLAYFRRIRVRFRRRN